MKWLKSYRMKLVIVGMVAAIVASRGQTAIADCDIGEATCVDKVINNGTNAQECSFLHDGLKLYFSYNLPGGYGNRDIWVPSLLSFNSALRYLSGSGRVDMVVMKNWYPAMPSPFPEKCW